MRLSCGMAIFRASHGGKCSNSLEASSNRLATAGADPSDLTRPDREAANRSGLKLRCGVLPRAKPNCPRRETSAHCDDEAPRGI